ncbi:ABC transporter permease [Rhodococcus ruber Chol-4]|uniref:ABC transporter permease n=1 Tax=Rhodococcus ruber TaxID=1830 RepID=A0A098BJ40_9NOCA|nr:MULTISPECIES: ABC transporter permease [Rhodococcus]RIK11054.1 MAG: ABC transporter permease [Acidobacteriota bacterium]ATQ28954.1 ABC transporter permease [Rhodococcus ruber]KXF83876.1 ABC transporter permease [Rhodococcus ruber Chol-4]MCD2127275.1 ABC transporter permease [Rhodococcus ruber]MCZ1070931.1 ABC transporter permease [Rhodococcus sp. A5(2022)]
MSVAVDNTGAASVAVDTVKAERIKLTSTQSPWWCTVVIVALGLGLAAILGAASKASMSVDDEMGRFYPTVDVAVSGVAGFGVLVLMILAALSVTSEYRFGVIRTTFQAMPNRSVVLVVKALLIGLFGAVLTGVLALASFALAKALAGPEAGRELVLEGDQAWRSIYGVSIYALLCAVLAVAVGALLRQSAGTIALLLLWPLLIESLFALFGSFGRQVQPFLPFANANHFLGSDQGIDFHWGPWGSLVYFAVFVAVVFAAALVVVNRRDA